MGDARLKKVKSCSNTRCCQRALAGFPYGVVEDGPQKSDGSLPERRGV